MAYEIRDFAGSLFKNKRMREGKKDPTHTGSMKVDGVEYWLDAWVNRPDGKEPFFSLKLRPKYERGDEPQKEQQPARRPLPPPDL